MSLRSVVSIMTLASCYLCGEISVIGFSNILSVNARTLVLRVFLNPTRPGYLTRFEVVGKPFNFRVICRL